jgi:hypothetical protein
MWFDLYLKGVHKAICKVSAHGFTVPNFAKEVIHYVQVLICNLIWRDSHVLEVPGRDPSNKYCVQPATTPEIHTQ